MNSGGVHVSRGSFCVVLLTFVVYAGCVDLLPLLEEPVFDFNFVFAHDRC
jgi:hypothetical protein